MWQGSAAICVNKNNQLLMVLQGAKGEERKWAIPSGGKKTGETFEECCIREVKEETGYIINIDSEVYEKNSFINCIPVKVKYFKVTIIGGSVNINDPDNLIYDVQWISINDLKDLTLSFPEDRNFLMSLLNNSLGSGSNT